MKKDDEPKERNSYHWPLWKFFHDEYLLLLTDSECDEILRVAAEVLESRDKDDGSFTVGGGNDPDAVKIWEWTSAPEEFKEKSRHGGKEDWVVFVPRERNTSCKVFDGYLGSQERFYLSGWGWGQAEEVPMGTVIIFAH